jgi:hypothetical protein
MGQLFWHSKDVSLQMALLSVALQSAPAGCNGYEQTVLLTGPTMGRQNTVALGVHALSSLPARVHHNTLRLHKYSAWLNQSRMFLRFLCTLHATYMPCSHRQ